MSEQNTSTKAVQLWFTAPYQVENRETVLPAPSADQILVRNRYSAVSAGTELLVYRGQLPESLALDSDLPSLQQSSSFPLQYGYACVGEVQQIGNAIDPSWKGRQVFSFQPHASHYLAGVDEVIRVPDDVSARDAVFLPNMETAVNLVHDGVPLLGERVVVLGQGVVGLLLTALLAEHPLASLVVVEGQSCRQDMARRLGADLVCTPGEAGNPGALSSDVQRKLTDADLVYEVSGRPEALNLAIDLAGFASRIVIGSWYGSKSAPVDLGGKAHRNRLRILTSQVSTLAPGLTGRWTKQRRFDIAWQMIRRIRPQQLITESVALQEAGTLYRQLDQEKSGLLQLLFHYED